MPDSGRKPPVPRSLGTRGTSLWRDVVGAYSLRVDELRLLEDACREADLIAEMHETLRSAPLMSAGRYAGMESLHPLIPEVRQHRALFARLLQQLGLPDADQPGAMPDGRPRSVQARAAAQSRWAKRP